MENIQAIKKAISKFLKLELQNFRIRYERIDPKVWDRQFEKDAISKKFDAMANQAVIDFQTGKCKEI